MSHIWTSFVTYERVLSHMNEVCHVWIMHVKHIQHAICEEIGLPIWNFISKSPPLIVYLLVVNYYHPRLVIVGMDLTGKLSEHVYAPDQGPKSPSYLKLDFGPEHKCSDGLPVKAVPTKSYLMATTTNWPKHGSSQQVYPHAGFSTVPRLVLSLPYASTGSTVCMHGERSWNRCCPSFMTNSWEITWLFITLFMCIYIYAYI